MRRMGRRMLERVSARLRSADQIAEPLSFIFLCAGVEVSNSVS